MPSYVRRQTIMINEQYLLSRYKNQTITITDLKQEEHKEFVIFNFSRQCILRNMMAIEDKKSPEDIFLIIASASNQQNIISIYKLNLKSNTPEHITELIIPFNPFMENDVFCVTSLKNKFHKNNFYLLLKEQFRPWGNRKVNYLIYDFDSKELNFIKKVPINNTTIISQERWHRDENSNTINPPFLLLHESKQINEIYFAKLSVFQDKIKILRDDNKKYEFVYPQLQDITLKVLDANIIKEKQEDIPHIVTRVQYEQTVGNKTYKRIQNHIYKFENEQLLQIGYQKGFAKTFSYSLHTLKQNKNDEQTKYLFALNLYRENYIVQIYKLKNIENHCLNLNLGKDLIAGYCIFKNRYFAASVINANRLSIKIFDIFTQKLLHTLDNSSFHSDKNLLLKDIYENEFKTLKSNSHISSIILNKIDGHKLSENSLSLIGFFSSVKPSLLSRNEQIEYIYKSFQNIE